MSRRRGFPAPALARAAVRAAAVAALAAGLALAACSDRDHTNPFDPANPKTGGRPANMRAVAGDGYVTLGWDDMGIEDLAGFEVLRRTEGGDFASLTPAGLARGAREYTDRAVEAHTEYGYVLAVSVNGQDEPLLGAEEPASPGPAYPWVADLTSGRAWLVSPDARDLVRSVFVSAQISDMAVVRETGDVWAADYAGNVLVHLGPSGERKEQPLVAPPGVAAVAVSADGSLVFAGSFDTGAVRGYGPGHAQAWEDDSTFTGIEDLAWSESDGSLWVADSGGRVARLDGATGRLLSLRTGFDRPFALAVFPGGAWLVEAGTSDAVHKLDATGDTVLAVWRGLVAPADVVDDPEGGCWVADLSGGRVVRLDEDLTSIVASVEGLSSPRAVRLDPVTRDVWVAEQGSGRIARISSGGDVVARVGGLFSPFALEIAWDPARR